MGFDLAATVANPWAWLVWGLVLVAADIFIFGAFLALAPGLAALAVALAMGVGIAPSDWRALAVVYAALSVAAIFPIRAWARRRKDESPDVNRY